MTAALVALCAVLLALAGSWWYAHVQAARSARLDAQSHKNFYALEEAIESLKKAQPDGCAPQRIEELVTAGYLKSMPLNPYSGQAMRALRITEHSSPGDYTYYPAGRGQGAPPGAAGELRFGYYLLVYGTAFSEQRWRSADCWTLARLSRLLPRKRILDVVVDKTGCDPPGPTGIELFQDVVTQNEGRFRSTT